MQYQASKQVDLARAEAITEKAFRAWQDVICPGTTLHPSIQLDDAFGPVGCNESEYNQGDGNANIIMFRDTSWPYDGASHVLALTTVSFGVKSGQIVDVDIEVNSTVHLGVNEDPEGAYDLAVDSDARDWPFFRVLRTPPIHRPPCGPNTPREPSVPRSLSR